MASEAAEVLSSIKGDLKQHLGGFRQAANDNNVQMTRIVKDIARQFAEQKSHIASLNDTIEENTEEARKTGSRIDNMTSVLQETINLQNQMVNELRNIRTGITSLTQFMANPVGSGVGGIGAALGGAAVGAGVGAVGASMLSGDLGGEVKGGWWTPERQKYAANYLVEHGKFTPYGAAGAVARMTKEAPGGPESVNKSSGAFGIAQWLGSRKVEIQGNVNFDDQLAHYVKESFSSEKRAGDMFRSAKTADEGAAAAMHFERAEGYKESGGTTDVLRHNVPVDTVYKNAFGSAPEQGTEVAKNGGESNVSAQKNQSLEQASGDATKVKGADVSSGSLPSPSDGIIALGKALQSQGLRVSEHPDFPPFNPKGHSEHSAHKVGRAIDINVGQGVTEADDKVAGARFDKLASMLDRLGYKVFWRGKGEGPYGLAGHRNHLHVEVPSEGTKSAQGQKLGEMAGLPPQRPTDLAAASEAPQAAPQAATQAMPVEQAQVAPSMAPSAPAAMIGGMIGGLLPGGLGGIVGPLISSLAEGLTAPAAEQPQQAAELQPTTPTGASAYAPMLQQAAVQTQAQAEIAQQQIAEPQSVESPVSSQIMNPMMGGGGQASSPGFGQEPPLTWFYELFGHEPMWPHIQIR